MPIRKYTIHKQSTAIGKMLQARIKFRRISKASVGRLLQRTTETFNEFTKNILTNRKYDIIPKGLQPSYISQ